MLYWLNALRRERLKRQSQYRELARRCRAAFWRVWVYGLYSVVRWLPIFSAGLAGLLIGLPDVGQWGWPMVMSPPCGLAWYCFWVVQHGCCAARKKQAAAKRLMLQP